MNNIQVIIKNPFEGFKVKTIEKSMDAFQKIVGEGFIETHPLGQNFEIITTEENKFWGGAPNLHYLDYKDIICGSIIIIKIGTDDTWVDLNKYDIIVLLEHLLPRTFRALSKEESEKIDSHDYIKIEVIKEKI